MSQSLPQQYLDQGYLIVRGLLAPPEIEAFRAEVDRAVEHRQGPILFDEETAAASAAVPAKYRDGTKVFRRLNRVIDRGGAFRQVALGKLADVARQVAGTDDLWVCLNRHNMLMLKAPYNPAPVEWHQDAAVWDEGTYEHITAIVALDDFRPENGALQVLPGSHRRGPLGQGWDQHVARIRTECAQAIRQHAVTLDLRAGDAALMHGLLLHGSPGNSSADPRRSLTIAYYPGDLSQLSTKPGVEVLKV